VGHIAPVGKRLADRKVEGAIKRDPGKRDWMPQRGKSCAIIAQSILNGILGKVRQVCLCLRCFAE
jgi:hypothetical protein